MTGNRRITIALMLAFTCCSMRSHAQDATLLRHQLKGLFVSLGVYRESDRGFQFTRDRERSTYAFDQGLRLSLQYIHPLPGRIGASISAGAMVGWNPEESTDDRGLPFQHREIVMPIMAEACRYLISTKRFAMTLGAGAGPAYVQQVKQYTDRSVVTTGWSMITEVQVALFVKLGRFPWMMFRPSDIAFNRQHLAGATYFLIPIDHSW